jgi:hypothetical protein
VSKRKGGEGLPVSDLESVVEIRSVLARELLDLAEVGRLVEGDRVLHSVVSANSSGHMEDEHREGDILSSQRRLRRAADLLVHDLILMVADAELDNGIEVFARDEVLVHEADDVFDCTLHRVRS